MDIAYVGSRTSRHRNGRGTGIETYSVQEGSWRRRQTLPMANPSHLVLSPRARCVYRANDAITVRVLDIDPATGQLSLRQELDSGGTNPVHLAFTPDHRFLIVDQPQQRHRHSACDPRQ